MSGTALVVLGAVAFVLLVSVMAALIVASRADEEMLRQIRTDVCAVVRWVSDGIPVQQTRSLMGRDTIRAEKVSAEAARMIAAIRSREAEITAASIIADDDVATRKEAR